MIAYHKELEKQLQEAKGQTLLLHSCCAPCSTYVLAYLREFLRVTVFYYNPNITREQEYLLRKEEQIRLIEVMNEEVGEKALSPIGILQGDYEPEQFFQMAQGLEQCPEGGARCMGCYEQRLRKTAKAAAEGGFDFFTTTLTISPKKNAAALNEIGLRLAQEYGITWLYSDFKKKNGYQQSVALSKQYGLYRQDYCGCIYSERDALSQN